MLALVSKQTGKYFEMADNGRSVTEVKTLKTATIFPEKSIEALNKLIESVSDKVELVHIQSTVYQEFILEALGRCRYNKLP